MSSAALDEHLITVVVITLLCTSATPKKILYKPLELQETSE